MYNLRQIDTTGYPILFPCFNSNDHISYVTGAIVSSIISKNGSSFVNTSGTIVEIGSGWYRLNGHISDRNTLGECLLRFSATGVDSYESRYTIIPFDPFDSVRLGLTSLPNASAGTSFGLPVNDAVIFGYVSSAATITGFLADAGLSSNDNIYQNAVLAFTSGSLKGISRKITNYVGSTKTIALSSGLAIAPSINDPFIIIGLIE